LTDYGGDEKDWRLLAELDMPEPHASLHTLVERLRGGTDVAGEVQAAVPHDVVVTHDGNELFAYAADQSLLATARHALEGTLRQDHITARIRVSHWDDDLDDWRQTDPLPSAQEQRTQAVDKHSAQELETRTVVASAGKLVRREFEQSLRAWAQRLGVECEVVDSPHLLSTQIGFTVTGPRRKVQEFVQGVKAEETASIRIERNVLLSQI
jgi:hypothetical protein